MDELPVLDLFQSPINHDLFNEQVVLLVEIWGLFIESRTHFLKVSLLLRSIVTLLTSVVHVWFLPIFLDPACVARGQFVYRIDGLDLLDHVLFPLLKLLP